MAFRRLGLLAAIDFGIQTTLSVVAIVKKTEKFYDLAGGNTFTLLAASALLLQDKDSTVSFRQKMNCAMVGLWATRLSCFLFWRVLKSGEDRRFRQAKQNNKMFFSFWLMQGAWVFLAGLPVWITNVRNHDSDEIDGYMMAGWSIFAAGFLIETIADLQKTLWRANPLNKGKWINKGLWALCQHPNYFGEIMLWFGIYLANVSSFQGWEHIGLISPVFTFLLLRYVSGVPLLQKYAKKKWGNDAAWRKYNETTPLLFFRMPKLFKKE